MSASSEKKMGVVEITRTKVAKFEFDIDEELERLHSCFKGKQLQRQLDIINAMFVEKDLEKVKKLYEELPRCKRDGFPEQEYVGLWISIFTGGWGEWEYLKDSDTYYEIN